VPPLYPSFHYKKSTCGRNGNYQRKTLLGEYLHDPGSGSRMISHSTEPVTNFHGHSGSSYPFCQTIPIHQSTKYIPDIQILDDIHAIGFRFSGKLSEKSEITSLTG
jgi:hypothetical protein